MTNEKTKIAMEADLILENLTHTLLYEGYSLYPYYRSAVKNQKPIPFGVIFPKDYNAYHEHSHSKMQSQSIITGDNDLTVSVTVRFLHLRKTELFQKANNEKDNEDYIPVSNLDINGKFYNSGWQTVERKITTGDIGLTQLAKGGISIPIEFDNMNEGELILNEKNVVVAKSVSSISEITGSILISAESIIESTDSFRITVVVTNTTGLENANTISRDEAIMQSFLSTHIILQTLQGEFISQQDTPVKWTTATAGCTNINTWPIVIDKSNTTLLSSPIILYDHPEINPQSSGDLFDSTEIEEALLLHVNLLTEEDRNRIGTEDEKMNAMLKKVNGLTPEDLHQYHSMLKENKASQFNNE
ncbi:hypothetical protein FW778_13550 [Ginsengibacter hankyongi]|uniref:Uncharacterized protein n=1 Tax=Ginsengibacter hankyongi TaxID=2607284 RepID=A0A5J5IEZ3_9BACT|nr:hypothetical protein [Ginsengibacter hankyongi]KAA9038578.1 hypothetical protein FW778_13550 [Ginsengibacter hankyongi]